MEQSSKSSSGGRLKHSNNTIEIKNWSIPHLVPIAIEDSNPRSSASEADAIARTPELG
jgi:hypothetical protein